MFETNDIIAIGEGLVELSTDDSLKQALSFEKNYGGDTLSAGVCACKMGSRVGYITKVGNDHFGEYLLSAWQSDGLDVSQVKLGEGHNGIYFVGKDGDSTDVSFYRMRTSAQMLSLDDIDFDYIKNTKAVYSSGFVQSLSLSCREVVKKIFEFAHNNNILVSYDVNYSKNIYSFEEAKEAFDEVKEYIDILFLNTQKDALALFGVDSVDKIHKIASDTGIKTVIVKEKSKAIHVFGENSSYTLPALNIEIIDTMGTEAVFNGAFLHFYLKGFELSKALKYAYSLGALHVKRVGAVKSIPTLDEVEHFYNEHYN